MLINPLYNLKLIRRLKGGGWVKTKLRGWIEYETYQDYRSFYFDPILIRSENLSYIERDPATETMKMRHKKLRKLL